MIRDIMRDPVFLAQKSVPATAEDIPIGLDLLETLKANAAQCVGMAANMIGESKRIIAVEEDDHYLVMYNPVILRKTDRYEAEEGCLSLPGKRTAVRYRSIKVQYQNEKMQQRIKTFTGWTAQIIQHECDHLEGILI